MITIILLLILAVLLFGSSALIGATGYALGVGAAAVALIVAASLFKMSAIAILAAGILGSVCLLALIWLIAAIIQPYEIALMEKRRKSS